MIDIRMFHREVASVEEAEKVSSTCKEMLQLAKAAPNENEAATYMARYREELKKGRQ